MSYILDALRKSEQERAAAAPAMVTPHSVAASAGLPKGTLIATAVLAILVGAGITVAWRAATAPHEADIAPMPLPLAAAPVATPAPPVLPVTPVEHGPRLADQLAVPARAPSHAVDAQPAAAALPAAPRDAPLLRQMPDDFRRSLPPLMVNIHVYSTSPDQCVLYINNHQYRAGDAIAPGLRVARIVEDGAILSYAGRDFKLPRPN